MDTPPVEPVIPPDLPACVVTAAQRYHIPLRAMLGVLRTEGGAVGQRVGNTNGTDDHGPFQINTVWVQELEAFGYTAEVLTNNYCASAMASAYILRHEINQADGDFWKGIGNYHSRTPRHHDRYVRKVYKNSMR
ncbi:lytic transglycosylase domain-containing protein [Halomonas elongata]|uniref:lytic transglycosylase domain-containing protein n=1 Tax=Halomonas elongata TaxID=2746 RepID=UPI00255A8D73|nr:lytic transglycosylase domain-containing protein [Halomonas elongata]MDL4860733.1 lytic transglycosylase domain-containing protein [Halomonas elongata]